MAKYFFNLHNHVETVDAEGSDFPDDIAALAYAQYSIRSMIAYSIIGNGTFHGRDSLDVLNADSVLIATIFFGDTITILS